MKILLALVLFSSQLSAQVTRRTVMEGVAASGNSIFIDTQNVRVGIGTPTPYYRLDVSGDIRSTGTIYGTFSGLGSISSATYATTAGIANLATKVSAGGVDFSTITTRIDALYIATATLTGNLSATNVSTGAINSSLQSVILSTGALDAAKFDKSGGTITGNTVSNSSFTANYLYGDGSHLTGISSVVPSTYAARIDALDIATATLTSNLSSTASALSGHQALTTTAHGGIASSAQLTSTAAALSAHEALNGTAHGGIIPSSATGTYPHAISGNAATVTTNANLTGPITSIGNATTIVGPVPVATIDLSTVEAAINLKLSSPTAAGQAGWVLTYDNGLEPTWQPAPSAAGLTYIMVSTASDVTGYKQMVSAANYVPSPRSASSTTITGVGQYISSKCTNVGYPGITTIPAGVWSSHKHMVASNANRFRVKFEAYIRNANGTEHEYIENVEQTPFLTTSEAEYNMAAVGVSTNILVTDRICYKLKVTVAAGAGTITVYDDGQGASQTNSRLEMPSVAASVANFVPYVGSTSDVNLGAKSVITSSAVTVAQMCIGTDCKTAWPTSSGGYTSSGTYTGVNTFSSSVTFQNEVGLKTYVETRSSDNVNNSAWDISWSSGSIYWLSLSSSTTLTFSGSPHIGQSLFMNLSQSKGGSKTVTWPAITWIPGSAPTLSTTDGATDNVLIYYNGTTYEGYYYAVSSAAYATTAGKVNTGGVDFSTITTHILTMVPSTATGSYAFTSAKVSAGGVDFSTITTALSGKVSTTSATMSGSLTVSSMTTTGIGVNTPQIALSGTSVVISSESTGSLGGGVRISSNVYIVGFSSATKYYGDGSALTGISATGFIPSTATGNYLLRVATATYLATAPGACSAGEFINSLTADGTKTCAAPAGGGDVVLASTQTFTGSNTFNSSSTFNGTIYKGAVPISILSTSTLITSASTNSGSAVDMGTLSLSIIAPGPGIIFATLAANLNINSTSNQGFIGINTGGTVGIWNRHLTNNTGKYDGHTVSDYKVVSAGTIVVKGSWYVEGGSTISLSGEGAQLIAIYIPYY